MSSFQHDALPMVNSTETARTAKNRKKQRALPLFSQARCHPKPRVSAAQKRATADNSREKQQKQRGRRLARGYPVDPASSRMVLSYAIAALGCDQAPDGVVT